jgi:transposase InsO family protein
MCQVLDVSQSGFYSWRERPASQRQITNDDLTTKIHMEFNWHKRRYGSPRITKSLNKQGIKCSKNHVAAIMKKEGLIAKQKRRFRKTTDSNHNLPTAPNILAGNFECHFINTAWVSDITYIWTLEGWLYLCAILDLCSKKVIGWAISESIDSQLVLDAFWRAYKDEKPPPGIIFHSDKGVQYACYAVAQTLKDCGVIQSMSRRGNPYDNAVSESFFNTIKTEEVYQQTYITKQQARTCLFEYIEIYYNRVRLHSALGYLSPVEFELGKAA